MKRYTLATVGLVATLTACADVSAPGRVPTDVQMAVATNCLARPAGIVSWWSGDDHAGDIFGGRHGEFAIAPSFAEGKVGSAFRFSAGNFVVVPDDAAFSLGSGGFTIELWASFSRVQGRDPFISHDEGADVNRKWIFWYDAIGHGTLPGPALRFHTVTPLVYNGDPVSAAWTPATGQWYHVAVARSGATYKLYIGGVLAASGSGPASMPNPAVELAIGAAEAFTFDGAIDEVSLYNRELSAGEISAIANAGSDGKCKSGLQPLPRDVLTPEAPVFELKRACELTPVPSGDLEPTKVPSGYLVVDTQWEPLCPATSPGPYPADNLWLMMSYRNPEIDRLTVCRRQPGGISGGVWVPLKAPPGWFIAENPTTGIWNFNWPCNNDILLPNDIPGYRAALLQRTGGGR